MILRSVVKHVKDQNWFAVGIDFVIVVFGVFIGIQVANWNEARLNHQTEKNYMERLHVELIEYERLSKRAKALLLSNLRTLSRVRAMLFGFEDQRALTQDECNAISLSRNPILTDLELPVITELENTGQLDLISNMDVRQNISRVLQRQLAIRNALQSVGGRSTHLLKVFPDLIQYQLKRDPDPNDEDGYGTAYRCDLENMLGNTAFLNAFGDNVAAYTQVLRAQYSATEPIVAALHESLDGSLKITHADKTGETR